MPHPGPVIGHWHHLVEGFNTSTQAFYEAVEEAIHARAVPDAEFSRVTFKEGGLASAKRDYLRVKRRKVAFDLCAAPYGTGFFFSSWLVKPRPAHPWLWLGGFLVAIALWLNFMMGLFGTSVMAESETVSLVTGCVFLLGFPAFPGMIWAFCWVIRRGYLWIDEEDVLSIPVLGFIYQLFFNPHTYFEVDSALMFQESVGRAVGEVVNGLLSEQGLRTLSPDELRPTIRDVAR